uniref:Hypothetical secreted peptide n=1 Tax=Glossina morsitans morsitans TaxID=37546 RepID=D3TSK3_GLOMM
MCGYIYIYLYVFVINIHLSISSKNNIDRLTAKPYFKIKVSSCLFLNILRYYMYSCRERQFAIHKSLIDKLVN